MANIQFDSEAVSKGEKNLDNIFAWSKIQSLVSHPQRVNQQQNL
jgi:hypothetical protein